MCILIATDLQALLSFQNESDLENPAVHPVLWTDNKIYAMKLYPKIQHIWLN